MPETPIPNLEKLYLKKLIINEKFIDSERELPDEADVVFAATFLVSPLFAGPDTQPVDIDTAIDAFSREILARVLSPKKAKERVEKFQFLLAYYLSQRNNIQANMSISDADFSQQQENLNTLALNIQAVQFIIVPEMAVEMLKIKKESPYRNGLPGLELE